MRSWVRECWAPMRTQWSSFLKRGLSPVRIVSKIQIADTSSLHESSFGVHHVQLKPTPVTVPASTTDQTHCDDDLHDYELFTSLTEDMTLQSGTISDTDRIKILDTRGRHQSSGTNDFTRRNPNTTVCWHFGFQFEGN